MAIEGRVNGESPMMNGADENEPWSTPDVEPQLLEDDDRSRCVSPFQGAPAIILGGLVIGIGAALYFWIWPGGDYVGMLTVSTCLVGVGFFAHGTAGIMRKRQLQVARLRHPREPWRYDYRWPQDGVRDDTLRRIVRGALIIGYVLLFLVPFNLMVLGGTTQQGRIYVFVVLGDLAVAIGLVYESYMTVRWIKYGRSYLSYRTFPFYLGRPLEVTFCNNRFTRHCRRLEITLRCIQERAQHGCRLYQSEVQRYQMYADKQVIDDAAELLGGEIAIRFDLPAPTEDLETQLSERPPRYWELMVTSEVRGIDFESTLLVPVYRPPSDERERR
jgi:hypothetical protein